MTAGDTVHIGTAARPDTLYDFGGFDPNLYTLRYPAPGLPAELLPQLEHCLNEARIPFEHDPKRGYDHGVWVPLSHLFPKADVPVFQLSMPHRSTPASAFALGRALQPLLQEGVWIVGSGSLTHNLYEVQWAEDGPTAQYVVMFDQWIRDAVRRGDTQALLHALERAPYAKRAHPTSEHFLPLPFAVGAAHSLTTHTVIEGGFAYAVLSMTSFLFGQSIKLP